MGHAYLLLALLATVAGAGAYGYTAGGDAARAVAERDKHASLIRALSQAEELARQDAEVLATHEVAAERIRTVFQSIDREVIRYVATHSADPVCLDAAGVRLWAAANAGDFPAGTGQPGGGLPATAAGAGDLSRGGPAGESRGGDAGVSRMPATASRPGGVGEEPSAAAAGIIGVLRRVTPNWGER